MPFIDINCDMGEGFGAYKMPSDESLFDYITSANIACGFHAGDPNIMEFTVKKAHEKGVLIGAHPGLPDLIGFGRREMKISPKDAYQLTLYQIGALFAFVKAAGTKLHHVKPHGALYNMAAKDEGLAKAIAKAVFDFDPSLILYGLAGSEMITAAQRLGLKTASEVFADRTYQNDGSLTPRTHKDALIHESEQCIKQVLMMVQEQKVISLTNHIIPLKAETLCIHGDGENAVDFAKLIYERLKSEGVEVRAVGS